MGYPRRQMNNITSDSKSHLEGITNNRMIESDRGMRIRNHLNRVFREGCFKETTSEQVHMRTSSQNLLSPTYTEGSQILTRGGVLLVLHHLRLGIFVLCSIGPYLLKPGCWPSGTKAI